MLPINRMKLVDANYIIDSLGDSKKDMYVKEILEKAEPIRQEYMFYPNVYFDLFTNAFVTQRDPYAAPERYVDIREWIANHGG